MLRVIHRRLGARSFIRSLSTETVSSNPLPPPPPPPKPTRQTRINPAPRRPAPPQLLSHLPLTFGRNQLLPVADSTRKLLESIVDGFDAPIRYAFAYGSGVFEQAGYSNAKPPMIDFVFAVSHPAHWHSINMAQYPSHYPLYTRALGSSFVSKVQEVNPGLWFNAYVPMNGVTVKYGVTTVDNMCSDLLNWNNLYLAGRMHKPIRIIRDDPRVRLTQQVNLTSAIRAALLTLPHSFSERELFERIAGFSYEGDLRMYLPAENRKKVANIVQKQAPQFKELYYRLVTGLPGVNWRPHSDTVEQDVSPQARLAHLKKLPQKLLKGVSNSMPVSGEDAFWLQLAGNEKLPDMLRAETRQIVRHPSVVQSAKGIVSAGFGKSGRYVVDKFSKWWKSSGSSGHA